MTKFKSSIFKKIKSPIINKSLKTFIVEEDAVSKVYVDITLITVGVLFVGCKHHASHASHSNLIHKPTSGDDYQSGTKGGTVIRSYKKLFNYENHSTSLSSNTKVSYKYKGTGIIELKIPEFSVTSAHGNHYNHASKG